MAHEDDAYWVGEMIRIIAQAAEIVRRGADLFFDSRNHVEFAAARMLVIDLDVAARNVSREFKDACSGVPWRALTRTRHKSAHHYEDIDRVVVWALLTHRLPEMEATLRRAVHDAMS